MKPILKFSLLIGILFATSTTLIAQTLTSIDPDNAQQGQSLSITITGQNTHFAQGSPTINSVWFSQGSPTINASSSWPYSDISLSASFNIPINATTGLWDVIVYNSIDGTLTFPDGFTVTSAPSPALTSIVPDTAQQGQTLTVVISGQDTNFQQGSGTTVWFSQGSPTIYANKSWPLNDTALFAEFYIPGTASTGLRDLNVYNNIDGTSTLYDGFTITPYNPSLTSITPDIAYQGQRLSVRITGLSTYFLQGSPTTITIAWFSQGSSTIFPINTWRNGPALIATFDIPEDTLLGLWSVHTPGGIGGILTLTDSFEIIQPGDWIDDCLVDTTPPTINNVSASPSVLWPPNRRMVEVTVMVDADDFCDPEPLCQIVDVTANEPINGPGDGTELDWDITGNLTVNLRAKRASGGTGRVYTIHIECTDTSSNTTIATVEVTVPHGR